MNGRFNIRNLYILLFLAEIIITLLFCIYNNFPFVYSDTGSYIRNGVEKFIPADGRPITYGLFLSITSLKISLWYVAITQAGLILITVHLLVKTCLGSRKYAQELLIIIMLSVTTSFSYVTGFIMPDIFTPMSCLVGFILILGKLSKSENYLLYFIYLISLLMHLSNSLINLILLSIILLLYIFKIGYFEQLKIKRVIVLIIINLISYPILSGINYTHSNSLAPSNCISRFVVARLSEAGILQDLLLNNCKVNINYSTLCPDIDELPADAGNFIWNPSSPSSNLVNCTNKSQTEIRKLIYDSFKNPVFIFRYIYNSLQTSIKLITNTGIKKQYINKNSYVSKMIKTYFPHEYESYIKSRQFNNLLNVKKLKYEYIRHRSGFNRRVFCIRP